MSSDFFLHFCNIRASVGRIKVEAIKSRNAQNLWLPKKNLKYVISITKCYQAQPQSRFGESG